jgi:protein MAK16
MEHDGRCFLYSKSIERAHTPSAMWEKRRLPANYTQALQFIDRELAYWPNFLIHKCKQRLTKIHQYLIRMRRIRLHSTSERRQTRHSLRALHCQPAY